MVVPNPFSTRFVRPDQVEFIFETGGSIENLVKRLETSAWRGQILGPHGTGKTTLIWSLVRILQPNLAIKLIQLQSHHKKLDEAKTLFQTERYSETENDLLIVDGFESLGWLERRSLLGRHHSKGRLLVSTHQDCGLPVLFQSPTKPEIFNQLVSKLTKHVGSELVGESSRLFEKHQGNCRDAIFELYDLFEQGR